jgi:L-ascorbate metabolism protein UlaG (beta-lactamase superfamily)
MVHSSEEQAQIDQRRKEKAARYSQLIADMTAEWSSPGAEDKAWLMYSANYLFRTGGVRWAMDPLTLRCRVPEAPEVEISRVFDQLDFVVLTHRHADHLDIDLLRAMRHLPIRWLIPDYILPQVQAEVGLPADQIIAPHPLQPIEIKGIHILPFVGLHWEAAPSENGPQHGVPEMGYLVEFNDKRWLFPGDTRDFKAELLPSFGPVDTLFAHLWLGRGCALMEEPPLLDAFCQFCLDLQPKQVILTHLEELGREADDYWDERHAEKVVERCRQLAPQVPVSAAYMGQSVNL